MSVGFHFSSTFLVLPSLVMMDGRNQAKQNTKQNSTRCAGFCKIRPPQTTPPRPQESSLAGYDRNRGSELGWELVAPNYSLRTARGAERLPFSSRCVDLTCKLVVHSTDFIQSSIRWAARRRARRLSESTNFFRLGFLSRKEELLSISQVPT